MTPQSVENTRKWPGLIGQVEVTSFSADCTSMLIEMATKTNHTEIAPEVDLDGSLKLTVSAQERVVRHDSRVSQATEYFNQLFQINLIRNEHPSLWASRGYYCYN